MIWLPVSHSVAKFVIALSLYSSLILAALLLLLVIRRDAQERRRTAQQARMKQLTREILRSDAAQNPSPLIGKANREELLEAALRLYQLVRGTDRERLTRFVEDQGLLAPVRKKLTYSSQARRVDAIRVLERIGSQQAIGLLNDTLGKDPALDVRLEAAAGLARLEALPKPAVIVAELGMESRPVTRLDHALLRSMAGRDAADLVALSKRTLPQDLQAAVIEALGWVPEYAGLAQIMEALENDSAAVRCAALRAARKLGHPSVRTALAALLTNADETVRAEAVMTASALKLRKLAPVIAQLTEDRSVWVRLQAREALKRMPADLRHA